MRIQDSIKLKEMKTKKPIVDYLLLLLLSLIWSISFLLIKVGVASIGPYTLTAGRMLIAAALLGLWLVITRTKLPLHRRALLLYLVVGFLGNTLPFILISWGEVYIDSSQAAIMMGIMPITAFLLSHYFVPDEPMTTRGLFGITLGLGGLIVLVGLSALGGIGNHVWGQLAVLGGAIFYGINAVFVRTQPAFPKTQMAAGSMLVGLLTSLPLAFLFEDPWTMMPTAEGLLSMFLLGAFSTAFAALIYFRLIHSLGATTSSQLNYLIPILGSIWGVILLDELLHFRMLIALGLVLAGIYFVQSGVARRK